MKNTLNSLTRLSLIIWVLIAASTLVLPAAWAADTDADGVDSATDNCPAVFNPLQADCNGDGIGDACNVVGAAGADTDHDGVCDAVDNCVSVANVDQSDCNGNGVGDICEGSAANRDDDHDGVCNGVDVCPREAGSCAMQAITVPWVPSDPSLPHPTYSGAVHTLKGIARYGGNQYSWDFGDGSAPTAWTAIANPYNLGVTHYYSGATGQVFTATLSVRNSANPTVVATATYSVKIGQTTSLPVMSPYNMDPGLMDVRIDMAIDQGLWYLHTAMSRSTYADGAPGYAQPYGYWPAAAVLAGSCAALEPFFFHGSRPDRDYAADPYVESVQRGLNYILAGNTSAAAISNQTHGVPDYNLNGIGILFGPNDTYTNGICGVSVAASGTPARQSLVGSSAFVLGRTYKDIVQDMAEWFAYGQADSGAYRGGWHYTANTNTADGSTNQWPILAIAAGEDHMAITTPSFVRSEAPFFMNYSRHAALDSRNGGWGYSSSGDYVNHVKTAAGMRYHFFEGNSPSHPEVQAALGFLYRYWASSNYDGGGAWNVGLGNSYAMYGIMKSMRKPQPNIPRVLEYNYLIGQQTGNGFDWYYTPPGQTQVGLATDLVRRQAADGSWSDTIGNSAQSGALATGWDIMILTQKYATNPPTAEICNCGSTWGLNQSVTMDGSCSTHSDPSRHIVSYEWDFDYAATFDVDATGDQGIKVEGYPAYGDYPIALRVTDDNPIALGGPQTAIATCSTSIKPLNVAPISICAPTPPVNKGDANYKAGRGQTITLDGSTSYDPDSGQPVCLGSSADRIVEYLWDLNNDGKFEASGMTVPYTLPKEAPLDWRASVRLQVKDDGSWASCNANSMAELTSVSTCTIEISSNLPPVAIALPYKEVYECSSKDGAKIALDGTKSTDPDLPNDVLSFSWLPAAGLNDPTSVKPYGWFGLGEHIIQLTVTDAAGEKHSAEAIFVVRDSTAPVLAVPADVIAEANAVMSTVAIGAATATDIFGATITNDAPATYPLGTALVTWTATDANGNVSSGTQKVTVIDTTAPAIAPHGNETAVAISPAGAVVTFTSPATTDIIDGASIASCLPASGSIFAVGKTAVTCTATDSAGNISTSNFTITVACSAADLDCDDDEDGLDLAAFTQRVKAGNAPMTAAEFAVGYGQ